MGFEALGELTRQLGIEIHHCEWVPSRAYIVDPWPMLIQCWGQQTGWPPSWFDRRPFAALSKLDGVMDSLAGRPGRDEEAEAPAASGRS